MSREPHIPLFLWVATALVVHAFWGGGAHEASKVIEETFDIRDFARDVRRHVRLHAAPVEVSLLDEEELADEIAIEPSPPVETPDEESEESPEDDDELTPEELLERKKREEEEKAKQEKKPEQKKVEEKKPEKAEEKKESPDIQQLKIPNRVAVRQHVENKDQEDNPDAKYIADDANHVDEETRAQITSTDQDSAEPTPGGHFIGSDSNPGNSEESRVAQSDDAPGDPDRTPGDTSGEKPRPAATTPPSVNGRTESQAQRARSAQNAPPPPSAESQRRQVAQKAQTAQEASPEVHHLGAGTWTMQREQELRERLRARRALPERRGRPTDLLGLGASGVTKSGINLNLSPDLSVSAVGVDQLARERRLDGERRRSAHRGSWKSMGLERWRASIENYVASVKPGNQTALNAARVPFARYLNAIHQRLHPVFADKFLASLDLVPKDHPLNREEMSTHLEIVLSKEDGRIVRMGVTKSSGVTAFDVGALDSVQRSSPFGPPPEVIVSPDGNVYLHWEFHRRPYYACSTYFARPYLLKAKPDSAPPPVAPPKRPPYDDEHKGTEERSGALDRGTSGPKKRSQRDG